MDWVDLAQDRDQWRDLVNTVKCWEVVEWQHNWQLLKKDPTPYVSNFLSH
jgi:hypothetical protein